MVEAKLKRDPDLGLRLTRLTLSTLLPLFTLPTLLTPSPAQGEGGLDKRVTLYYKATMQSEQATEHLQVIRTLMERSAMYRRALAPIMLYVGVVGLVAAFAGWKLEIRQPQWFIGFW